MKKLHSIQFASYIICLLSGVFLFSSCQKDENIEPYLINNRTVLVYILGNNSLSYNANTDLSELVAAARNNPLKGTLLCFFDDNQPGATLYKIDQKGKSVIKEYPAGYKTATPEAIKEAMNIAKSEYPAPGYGLVLWSHGSGWLPSNAYSFMRTKFRSLNYPLVKNASEDSKAFGQDGSDWLELGEIKSSLNDHELDFLIFDACYMGEIEVFYELKDKTDFIIGSPAEILSDGFPYEKVTPLFFEKSPAIKDIASTYFEHYNSKTGWMRSATITAVNTRYLGLLAEAVKSIYSVRYSELQNLPVLSMQYFDRYNRHTMFDLGQIIRMISPDNYPEVANIFNQAIVYKNATPVMFENNGQFLINPENYSGFSSYIPYVGYKDLNMLYLNTDWGKYLFTNQ
ncbi:MAG: clostripain-related cysteine peptidase [Bacteroidales bacterium]